MRSDCIFTSSLWLCGKWISRRKAQPEWPSRKLQKQSVKEMRPDSGYGGRRDDFRGRVEENLAGPGNWFYIEGDGESSLGTRVRYRTKEKQGFGRGRGWFLFSHEEMTGPCRECPRGSEWDWLRVKRIDDHQQCMQLRPWADPLTQEGVGEGPIMRTEHERVMC